MIIFHYKIICYAIILLILIYYIIHKYKNRNNTIFYNTNKNIPINLKKFMNIYFKGLSPNEILFKTDHKFNTLKNVSLYTFYVRQFMNFTEIEKNHINYHLKVIKHYTKNFNKIYTFSWRFIKFSDILDAKNCDNSPIRDIEECKKIMNTLSCDISATAQGQPANRGITSNAVEPGSFANPNVIKNTEVVGLMEITTA